jgi:desulfoferrodoxin (superoxide reductase-like protein)
MLSASCDVNRLAEPSHFDCWRPQRHVVLGDHHIAKVPVWNGSDEVGRTEAKPLQSRRTATAAAAAAAAARDYCAIDR